MANKKPSAAQIAARKLFAARAKAGAFKGSQKTKRAKAQEIARAAKRAEREGLREFSRGSGVEAAEAELRLAKKHAARRAEYSGKYPNHIKSVQSIGRGVVLVTLNSGEQHQVSAADVGGVLPRVGDAWSPRKKNPVESGLGKGSAEKQQPFTYEVQRWGAHAGVWFRVAGFDYPEDAVAYAKALARKEPAWKLRVVDNYGR